MYEEQVSFLRHQPQAPLYKVTEPALTFTIVLFFVFVGGGIGVRLRPRINTSTYIHIYMRLRKYEPIPGGGGRQEGPRVRPQEPAAVPRVAQAARRKQAHDVPPEAE